MVIAVIGATAYFVGVTYRPAVVTVGIGAAACAYYSGRWVDAPVGPSGWLLESSHPICPGSFWAMLPAR